MYVVILEKVPLYTYMSFIIQKDSKPPWAPHLYTQFECFFQEDNLEPKLKEDVSLLWDWVNMLLNSASNSVFAFVCYL